MTRIGPVAACLEPDRVDRGIHFGDAEDLLDLLSRVALRHVDALEAE